MAYGGPPPPIPKLPPPMPGGPPPSSSNLPPVPGLPPPPRERAESLASTSSGVSSVSSTPRSPGRARALSSPRGGPPPPMPTVPSFPPPPGASVPSNLPPPPASSLPPPMNTLPPPPASSSPTGSPSSPHKEKDGKKKDKKLEKAEKEAAKAAEKDRKKAEKEAEKEAKKRADEDKKHTKEAKKDKKDKKPESPPPLTKGTSTSSVSTPSDSSSEPMSKEDRKKQEEEAEELSFSATFDKSSFLYNRIKNFPAPDQLEGKYRIKTTSWADRWIVLYCDFILYYETKGSAPRDFDKPVGALRMDSVVHKRVKDFEERMEIGGLVPRTIMYDFCFEVPIASADGKERVVLLQFDRAETQKAWREKIKAQAKNIEAVKGKVTGELKNTIEMLMNKYPMTNRLKEAPHPNDEEKWIKTLKDHWNARNKYRKDLRRAQLFSEFYLPNYKAYIDWFVTSGGEAGVASLEKELMIAEDSVVNNWKQEFTGGLATIETEVDALEKDNEVACRNLLTKMQRKSTMLKMHILYMKEIYPAREVETFDDYAASWKSFEDLIHGYIDSIHKGRLDNKARMELEAQEARRKAEAEEKRREEERRNDPFGDPDDDDPFADTKVVSF